MNEEKVKIAIERLKLADQMSRKYFDAPLYVCISGGKDSSVITQLAIESGLDVIFSHSHTTVDMPPTVYFVRSEMKRLAAMGYKTQILYPKKSMWQLIEEKDGMPPLRIVRYCCKYFKERHVRDDRKAFIVTGVRWDEGWRRREKRGEFEAKAKDPRNAVVIKENDNGTERKLFEECRLRSERICNPIIDWTNEEVWEYLGDRKCPTNILYKLGFERIGCIGCPLTKAKDFKKEFAIFPRYKKCYIDAIRRGLIRAKEKGKELEWGTDAEARFKDWTQRSSYVLKSTGKPSGM